MLTSVRVINLALGVWLAGSTFVWSHSDAQLRNAWIVGITAVVAASAPRLIWFHGVLALWLFVSAFALAHITVATVWNSVLVAVIMFSMSIAETKGAGASRC
jgi:hypothetical protein